METMTLYHGTPDKIATPRYGGGDDKHDYGRGFYLTESIELAKEWAVCRPNDQNGWVQKHGIKSETAYANLRKKVEDLSTVDYAEFNDQ